MCLSFAPFSFFLFFFLSSPPGFVFFSPIFHFVLSVFLSCISVLFFSSSLKLFSVASCCFSCRSFWFSLSLSVFASSPYSFFPPSFLLSFAFSFGRILLSFLLSVCLSFFLSRSEFLKQSDTFALTACS